MLNEFACGFVAIFDSPLDWERIKKIVSQWLDSCERVEQVIPNQVATTRLEKVGDIIWGRQIQFRLINGEQFAWVYININGRSIETTGTPAGSYPSLCLTSLCELPGIIRVIEDSNHALLDEMEKDGLI